MGISEIDSLQAQENIFIVGMPRSGSTLVESIISINKDVIALGEVNFLEDSLFEWSKIKNNISKITVAELYRNKIKSFMKIVYLDLLKEFAQLINPFFKELNTFITNIDIFKSEKNRF